MAEVIVDEDHKKVVSPSYSWWRVALVGAALGILYWALTFIVSRFIVDPLFCRPGEDAVACANSIELAGNIATILIATAGLGVLVALRVMRPLFVAVSAAIVLWGLASWTNGMFWGEVAFWSALLYGLAYVLFSWISRYGRTVPVLVAIVLILVVARIVLAL